MEIQRGIIATQMKMDIHLKINNQDLTNKMKIVKNLTYEEKNK